MWVHQAMSVRRTGGQEDSTGRTTATLRRNPECKGMMKTDNRCIEPIRRKGEEGGKMERRKRVTTAAVQRNQKTAAHYQ